jgi:hypothetical protein
MKALSFLLIISLFAVASCSRDGKCDCVPPPTTETNWKMTRIFGGFGGTEVALNDDQKNSILTTRSNGSYTCTNTITGQTTNGTIITTSQGNGLTQVTFSPLLTLYRTTNFWLNEKTNTTMVLAETNPDGYVLTFTAQ